MLLLIPPNHDPLPFAKLSDGCRGGAQYTGCVHVRRDGPRRAARRSGGNRHTRQEFRRSGGGPGHPEAARRKCALGKKHVRSHASNLPKEVASRLREALEERGVPVNALAGDVQSPLLSDEVAES